MASKNPKSKRVETPQAAVAPAPLVPGRWETTIRPFLDRRALPLAIVLLLIGAARIGSTWSRFCYTNDEPQHFACGLEYLEKHVYKYETQQPPLSRAAMALLPYFDGARLTGKNAFRDREGIYVMYQKGNPQRVLILMRAGILPFFLLCGMVVFLWARHHFGPATAVLATALFTLEPTVLAHAGLATTDMAFTACLTAAFFAMILWAEAPTRRNALLFGLCSGLALLAKFTALIYLPSAATLALLYYLAMSRSQGPAFAELAKQRAASFGLALLTGALVVWAGYFFSFGKPPGWSFPVPAPEWFDGIHAVLQHNEGGHQSFLLGQFKLSGWWYFFPVVLAVKTPVAYLLLAIFGVVLCLKHKQTAWGLPVAFSLGILLPAMAGNLNLGLRHILPIYSGLSIAAAVAVVQLARWASARKWAGAMVIVGLLWLTAAGALSHPYYLAYFNELAAHPENIVVDSDYDWSQDYIEVAQKLREMNVKDVNFGYVPWLNPFFEVWPGFPKTKGLQPLIPAAGWAVVSPSASRLNQYGLLHRYPQYAPWWEKLTPQFKVGSTEFYYVPPEAIRLRQPGQ